MFYVQSSTGEINKTFETDTEVYSFLCNAESHYDFLIVEIFNDIIQCCTNKRYFMESYKWYLIRKSRQNRKS